MSHYTFVWADLAAEVAPYWDRNRQSGSQQRTFDPEEDVDNLRDVHRSAGPLKQGSNRRQAGTMRQAAQGSKELGARPQSANSSTAGRTADSKKAKLAFVDSPKFLAPTGVHESGDQQLGLCWGHSSLWQQAGALSALINHHQSPQPQQQQGPEQHNGSSVN